MSLPLHTVSNPTVRGTYIAPADEPYLPLEEAVLGGTAVGDGDAGRSVQRWTVFYDGTDIKVAPESGPVEFTLTVPGVTTVSLAFDANMGVVIAYQTATGSHLHYYDSLLGAYNTLTILGATSCRAGLDDYRTDLSSVSDVIFAYTLDSVLHWREQRDRYLVQYTAGPSHGLILLRTSQTVDYRMQFKLGKYTPF